MSCDSYIELISAQLDGELTETESQTLSAHLDTCPKCRAVAHDFSLMHTAMTNMVVPAPESLSAQVVLQHRQQKKASHRRTLRQLSALAACLLLTVGILRVTDAVHSDRMRQQEQATPLTARTVDNDQPVAHGEPDHYAFTHPQTIRVTYGSTPHASSAVILGSRASLESFLAQFPSDDLSHVAEAYSDEFFLSQRLLAVLVEAESGSITHTLPSQALTWDCVTVQRTVPSECTDDMAAWLLIAQVDSFFQDGHTLAVEYTE